VGRERSAQNLTGTAWGGAWVAGGTQDREIGAVGGRQGRGIVDVGDLLLAGVGKKTFKEEPGGEKTGRRWLGAVSGRDRGWVRVRNSLFHTRYLVDLLYIYKIM